MWPIVILFLLLVGMLVLIMLGTGRIVRRVAANAVRGRLEAAQLIHETGMVPPAWAKDQPRDERFRSEMLRRLAELCGYFERAPVFSDDQARIMLLDGLAKAKARWETADISTLMSPPRP